jgi:NitT/TauT family transport system substrate-binding protein
MNTQRSARGARLRTRLAAGALVLVLGAVPAACGGDDDSGGSSAVKVGYYPGALVSLPALVADAKGFYAANGLDVSLVQVPNGPAMTSGLASGSLDFVNNSYDNLAVAVDKKLPVKAVVGNTTRVPFKLLVNKDVPLPHGAEGYPAVLDDLVGLDWGVIALGVSLQYLDEALLTSSGHQADDVTFLAVGLGDSARAALTNGTVDTYIATEPLPSIAAATGEARVAVDLVEGEGPPELANLDYNGWWATDKTVSTDPDTVASFVKANEDAYCWYSDPANLDELVTIIKKAVPVPALDDEQYAAMVEASLPSFGVTIKDESLATWQGLLVDNGLLKAARDRTDLVNDGAPDVYTCPQ